MRQTPDKMKAFLTLFRKKMNLRSLVVTLAAIVVFTTTYLLILPAFTLDKEEAIEQGGIDIVEVESADADQEPGEGVEAAEEEAVVTEAPAADQIMTKEETRAESETAAEETEESAEVRLLKKQTMISADKASGDSFAVSAVIGKDAKVPEDVMIKATELDKDTDGFEFDQYKSDALDALKKDSKDVKGIKSIKFYDISLESDTQEESVEPSAPVSVKIEYDEGMKVSDADNIRIVHFIAQENGTVKPVVLDTVENKVETATNANGSKVTEASFDTDGFSTFAVVEVEIIEKTVITADGKTYKVTVSYGKDAEIPEGADLAVNELEGKEFEEYLNKTAEALDTTAGEFTFAKIFDIKIMNGDKEVKIAAPVDVEIKLIDSEGLSAATKVVHFGNEPEELGSSVDGDTVKFEAEGFSVYSVVSHEETANLNGKEFAIINTYTGGSIQAENRNDRRLRGLSVSVLHNRFVSTTDSSSTEAISVWKFTDAGNGKYYIQNGGLYMNINASNNGGVQITNTPQALNVAAGTGTRAGQIRITNDNGLSINNFNGTPNDGFGPYNDNGDNEWHTLFGLGEVQNTNAPSYFADKISVQDIEQDQYVIIYRSVFNEYDDMYEDYVIDGNGNLVRSYDKGDEVAVRSVVSPLWKVIIHTDSAGNPNGYYDFYNEETGMYLSPQGNGDLVSTTRPGVNLDGRRDGNYTSTILKWDNDTMAYYGYTTAYETSIDAVLESVREENAQTFSFAAYRETTTHELHPVETVDSVAAGIKIEMFDYANRDYIRNITGSDSYNEGVLPASHVRPKLSDDGYPVFTNNKTGKDLFDTGNANIYKGSANHLFLESIYDSTGYYEYNAFNNFAHYDSTDGNFIVYKETGTPDTDDHFYYRRGNFFPFNNLDIERPAVRHNDYDGNGDPLEPLDPTLNGTLYKTDNPNYYFGMTMETTFMQAKGGMKDGEPILYEFNGDDDLWIFIDGVRILDIGGVHDAWQGSINFQTGEIHYGQGVTNRPKTIKDCFKEAGVFPDGTAWDDAKVNDYFSENTFKDYTSHDFKMFYMEHGAGASNLEMRFNLSVIEKGKFTVEKVLEGTNQQRFANVDFAYQAFQKNPDGEDIPLTGAVYEGRTDADGNPVPVPFQNGVVFGNTTYNNVFFLKHGEAAVFPEMDDNVEYYVQEIGVDTDEFEKVFVNDVQVYDTGNGVFKTTNATVLNRARVTYGNLCSEKYLNELRITKRISEGSVYSGETFEFRVLVEDEYGELVPYGGGQYYIQDDSGNYYYYVDGELVSNGQEAIVASTSGPNGTIAGIPKDYTVVIKDFIVGTDFFVEEIRNPDDWKMESKTVDMESCGESTLTGIGWSGNSITADGQIIIDKDAKEVITNKFRTTEVKLKKTDESGETLLSGSGFTLYRGNIVEGEDDESIVWTDPTENIEPGKPDEEDPTAITNPISLGKLAIGLYKLTETKAPDGYVMLTKDVCFEVYKDGEVLKVRLTDESGNPLTESDIAGITSEGTGEDTVYTITVMNTPGQELPMTGGPGTTIFYILGGMLILGCGTVLIRRRRHA